MQKHFNAKHTILSVVQWCDYHEYECNYCVSLQLGFNCKYDIGNDNNC
jgi:hypothetical protein